MPTSWQPASFKPLQSAGSDPAAKQKTADSWQPASFKPTVEPKKASVDDAISHGVDTGWNAAQTAFDVASYLPRKAYGFLGKEAGRVGGAIGGALAAPLADYAVYIDPNNPLNKPADINISSGETTPAGYTETEQKPFADVGQEAMAGARTGFHDVGPKVGQAAGEFYGGVKTFGALGKIPTLALGGSQMYGGMKKLLDPGSSNTDRLVGTVETGLGAVGTKIGAGEEGGVFSKSVEDATKVEAANFKQGFSKGFKKDPNFVKDTLFQDSLSKQFGESVGKTFAEMKPKIAEFANKQLNKVATDVLPSTKRFIRLESRQGKDISQFAVDEGILPFVKPMADEPAKVDTQTAAIPAVWEKINEDEKGLDKIYKGRPIRQSIDTARDEALAKIQKDPMADAKPGPTATKIQKINEEAEALKENYRKNGKGALQQVNDPKQLADLQAQGRTPDVMVWSDDFNILKRGQQQQSNYSYMNGVAVDEPKVAAEKDAHKVFGQVMRSTLETSYADVANINGINSRIGDLLTLEDALQQAHGSKISGKGLSNYVIKGGVRTGIAIALRSTGLEGEFLGQTVGAHYTDKAIDWLTQKIPYLKIEQLTKLYEYAATNQEASSLIEQAETNIIRQKYPDYKTTSEQLSAKNAQLPAPDSTLALPKPPGAQPTNVLPAGEDPIVMGGRQAQTKTPAVIELPESSQTLTKAVEQLKAGEVKAGDMKQTVTSLKEAQRQMVQDYLQTEAGYQISVKNAATGDMQSVWDTQTSPDVVVGIKNNPYFMKQGDVQDSMGQGWLMENAAGRKVVASPGEEVDSYLAKGYTKRIEIDQLAQEAGYDNGMDYLNDQLYMSGGSKVTTDEVAAHHALLKSDPAYKNLDDTIKKINEELADWKTEKVPLEQRRDILSKQTSQTAFGAIAGVQPYQDKDGKWRVRYNPKAGAIGVAGMALGQTEGGQKIAAQVEDLLANKSVTAAESDAFKALLDMGENKDYRAVGKDLGMTTAKVKAAEAAVLDKLGMTADDVVTAIKPAAMPEPFKNFPDLSTKVLGKLEGKTTVSKQFISDLTNSGELKQTERDIIRAALEGEGDKVNVQQFADKVKAELLPLKVNSSDAYRPEESRNNDPTNMVEEGKFTPKYESIALPSDTRGSVASYQEKIYESPIQTFAGDVHFNYTSKNYFGHTRVEEMADGSTRRVIEVQSDLYQKGNLEQEMKDRQESIDIAKSEGKFIDKNDQPQTDALKKLQQYNDPTAHFRMIREEVKQAAKDGKNALQFPTGDTAMKIERLGGRETAWGVPSGDGYKKITPEDLDNFSVGTKINDTTGNQNIEEGWIITELKGDGKFKAVPNRQLEFENDEKVYKIAEKKGYINKEDGEWDMKKASTDKEILTALNSSYLAEEFSVSSKVDTNNPIYKFYEKEVGKYLKNKYGATPVTDAQGVTWNEIKVNPKMADLPVEAFGMAPIAAAALKSKKKK